MIDYVQNFDASLKKSLFFKRKKNVPPKIDHKKIVNKSDDF